jgi:hypothetical protein
MDNKLASLILVALLVGASIAVFALSSNDEESKNDTESQSDEVDQGGIQTPPENVEPTILVENRTSDWTGVNHALQGYVVDEDLSSVSLEITMLNQDFSPYLATITTQTEANGFWEVEFSESEPGQWLVRVQATDSESATVERLIEYIVNVPDERDVDVVFSWTEPTENETTGLISGAILHQFPETCSIKYHPLGASSSNSIIGEVNTTTGTYSITFDVSTTNTEGDIITDCGLYTTSSQTLRVDLPVTPSSTDSDNDGIPDLNDDCDDTPSDEPVYGTGCSDSETDSDQDGVMNDVDLCPDTELNRAVNPDGCSQYQLDADNDGVSNAVDQCSNTPLGEQVDSSGCSDSQKDTDGDGISDDIDQCPNTPSGEQVGPDGCTLPDWAPEDSWVCTDGQGPWVKDFNGDGNGYTANTNGVSSPGGGGSGPWFQCEVSVTVQNNEMIVDSNGIPNHDFLSTMGCCAPEKDYTATFPLNPVNDTTGGHDTTNCPASAGRWECVPDRGTVAMSVNGAPIFGPEEGPGGDAVALHFEYFTENRQPITLGWCTGHSAGQGGYHYHYDANCVYWEPEAGETMEDYDPSKIKSDEHSPIIGWAFDGYPIYGMYGYNDDQTSLKAITSSYAIERTQEGGDQGYNGIDDWNYVAGVGDLDECNGRFGPTPEYPDGIYHYVSTPLSGSPTMVTDTNGQTVGMIGFPYFLLCYHGVADVAGQDVGGGQGGGGGGGPGGGGGGPPGGGAILYSFAPEMDYLIDHYEIEEFIVDVSFSILFLALIGAGIKRRKK